MKQTVQTLLHNLETEGITRRIPNITRRNAEIIHFLVQIKEASRVLEIGTANGYSSLWFCDAIAHKENAKFVGIEKSEPIALEAENNLEKAGFSDISTIHKGDALLILPTLTTPFDIIFIDAQKRMYIDFWHNIQHLIHDQTLIIADDMEKFKEKTFSFLQELKHNNLFQYTLLQTDPDDAIALIYRCASRREN